jgi:hypothetical protein
MRYFPSVAADFRAACNDRLTTSISVSKKIGEHFRPEYGWAVVMKGGVGAREANAVGYFIGGLFYPAEGIAAWSEPPSIPPVGRRSHSFIS